MYNGGEFPHGLIRWEKQDMPQMRDFNQDNQTLDEEALWKSEYDPRGFERDVYGDIYSETPESTALLRVINAPNIDALEKLTDVPFYVRAACDGAPDNVTLMIQGQNGADLGTHSLKFPQPDGSGMSDTAPAGWIRAGGVYMLVLSANGDLVVLNPQVQAASTETPGVVQLSDTLDDTSTSKALTAAQGKALEDKKADRDDVLLKDNTSAYTPSSDYNPATKKYVDSHVPPAATTSQAGVVKLNNTVNSTSTTEAATANAVRLAYEKATGAASRATSADKLTTARTIRTNLASTAAPVFDGTANITPGVQGTLPIANGGTGAATLSNNSWLYRGTGAVAASTRTSAGLPGWNGSGVPTQYPLPLPVANGGTGQTSLANVNVGSASTATTAAKLGRSGNAGVPMTFNWSGQTGQPTWLWGSNDGSNIYVWNPANFNVNYANSAGYSSTANTANAATKWNNMTYNQSPQTPRTHFLMTSDSATAYPVHSSYFARTDISNTFAAHQIFSSGLTTFGLTTTGNINFNSTYGQAAIGSNSTNPTEILLRSDNRVKVVGHSNSGSWKPIAADAFNVRSSIRFKEAVKDEPDNSVSKLAQLNPVTFEYKDKPGKKRHGLIAEELCKHFPEAVTYDENGDIEGITYHELIGPIIKAFQEQQKIIANMQKQLDSLALNKKTLE